MDETLSETARVMNGLRKGARYLHFKHILATVKSCHFSHLYYSVQVRDHDLTLSEVVSLQSAENKTRRWVTKPRTSSAENIRACGGVLIVRHTGQVFDQELLITQEQEL